MAVLSAKEGEKQMEKAKVHIYCGDGKGKTTAAIGLSVRSCGRGWPVVLSQFLKGSTSGELNVLRTLPDYHYIPAPTTTCKFIFQMTEQEKADYGRQVRRHFADTVEAVEKYHAKLLVLDEVLDAVAMGPTRLDYHSPKERLSISSSIRFEEFLKQVLEQLQ